jgi:hypothetical protein
MWLPSGEDLAVRLSLVLTNRRTRISHSRSITGQGSLLNVGHGIRLAILGPELTLDRENRGDLIVILVLRFCFRKRPPYSSKRLYIYLRVILIYT